MAEYIVGQKWISNAEPELAMGRVIKLAHRTISVFFDISSEERTYARDQAPLSRVKFNPGDKIATQDGILITVKSVKEKDGIFIYHGDYLGTDTFVMETELDPNVRFSKPQDRLFTHQFDDNAWFNLRYDTWCHASRLANAKNRGLYGPRVSLVPHQMYIANEVAGRFAPRVLLADEVGLGKTIEAGLIVHQQLQTGRAARVLIIVPEALTFQWFVEMIRRFNLQFTVLDEERCQQIIADNTEEAVLENDVPPPFNPFDAQQLMLCSLDLFTQNSDRIEQMLETTWDLLVIDEAHHLRWNPDEASIEYSIVELFAKATKGLLLLTATPEQLGRTGHFARLKLLDPNRFHDYELFVNEEYQFESIADAAYRLLQGSETEKAEARLAIRKMVQLDASDADLIDALLDRHGTGRVLFRNVRSAIKGFPDRLTYPVAMEQPAIYTDPQSFFPQKGIDNWVQIDPRIPWIIEMLQTQPQEKFLLICAHQQTALDLEQRLSELVTTRITVFHEGMDLIARDRAANYFAETNRGAQLLISSEIGSEGRNFQFASHLILFDLPLGPDLLEQRIGRLDRIGQRQDVKIHIPYFTGTAGERLYRFYEEALGVFTAPNPAAQSIFDELAGSILDDDLDHLIATATALNATRQTELNKGRDRLLELNSHRPEVSGRIVMDIDRDEGGKTLENYMEQSFEIFGLESEYTSDHVITIKPTESMLRNNSVSIETLDHYHYPELPEDGIRVTYDRPTALANEDIGFFTWENPMVQQAMDLVNADVTGNSTMVAVKHPELKAGTLLVEVLHVVDCVAAAELMADRFLPPAVIRSMINPDLDDLAGSFPFQTFVIELLDVPNATLGNIVESQMDGIKTMIARARELALEELERQKNSALTRLNRTLDQETTRLVELEKVNESVRPEEIDHLRQTHELLRQAIARSDVRMDAIRVVVAG
ncbi:MAG: RNA polymerase-associated protein RapA [bacterium]